MGQGNVACVQRDGFLETEMGENMKKEAAEVLWHEVEAEDIFDLGLRVSFAGEVRPGQFVMVWTGDGSRLLGRPISICEATAETGEIRLVYRQMGAGTKALAKLAVGESVEVMGPLGNGFPVEAYKEKRVLLVGGGIGIPPLVGAGLALEKPAFAVGYRSETYLMEELPVIGDVLVATEDGSLGTKGNVVDALLTRERVFARNVEAAKTANDASLSNGEGPDAATNRKEAASESMTEELGTAKAYGGKPLRAGETLPNYIRKPGWLAEGLAPEAIFTCGPLPMLRAVAAFAEERDIPCFVSMEERMACGVGACLGCVTKTKHVDAHSGVTNARICKEGPVFDAREVVL